VSNRAHVYMRLGTLEFRFAHCSVVVWVNC
jgi:hypothetical protein